MLCFYAMICAVKLVYKDHPTDRKYVALICRWSFYTGSITWRVCPWGPVNVVIISSWSLYTGVFRTDLTVRVRHFSAGSSSQKAQQWMADKNIVQRLVRYRMSKYPGFYKSLSLMSCL